MPDWVLRGTRPPFETEERCRITEVLNDPSCPEVSLALAEVAPGVRTRLHLLRGTVEIYLIRQGLGRVEVGGEAAEVGPGDRVVIAAGVTQRIEALGAEGLAFWCLCTPRFVPENYVDLGD